MWDNMWNKMASALEEDVRQIALLMNDTSEFVVIVEPRCRRFLRKPLDTSESRILKHKQI